MPLLRHGVSWEEYANFDHVLSTKRSIEDWEAAIFQKAKAQRNMQKRKMKKIKKVK